MRKDPNFDDVGGGATYTKSWGTEDEEWPTPAAGTGAGGKIVEMVVAVGGTSCEKSMTGSLALIMMTGSSNEATL